MNKLSITIIICTGVLCLLFAFKSPQPLAKKSYQHLFIVTEGIAMQKVFISIDGKDYSYQNRLKKESQGDWDANPLINLIHQYESEGGELQSFNQGGVECNCWLRREAK